MRRKVMRTRREKFIWQSDEANALYDVGRDPHERAQPGGRECRARRIACAGGCSTGFGEPSAGRASAAWSRRAADGTVRSDGTAAASDGR